VERERQRAAELVQEGAAMTETLLLPCAGLSTRYRNMRPKWMLTTPDGRLAIQRAAASIDPAVVGRRVIAIRAEHDEKYGASQVIRRAFGADIDIVVLERDTNGPAETVSLMIERAGVRGPIRIKDADSFFDPSPAPQGSFVGTCDLRDNLSISRVGAKSFVVINEQSLISHIIEKHVSSNFISAGLYAFADSSIFVDCYRTVFAETSGGERFVSHVVAEAIRQGEVFKPYFVSGLIDVGTLEDWRVFTQARRLLLIDIDGVVFRNQSEYFPPYWGDPVAPIEENIERLRELQSAGAQLVFVTSRTEKYRDATLQALKDQGLAVHSLVMGCIHSPRVLINDFADSNPYPSATAVNLPRNSTILRSLLP
jgi:hypothetical protein